MEIDSLQDGTQHGFIDFGPPDFLKKWLALCTSTTFSFALGVRAFALGMRHLYFPLLCAGDAPFAPVMRHRFPLHVALRRRCAPFAPGMRRQCFQSTMPDSCSTSIYHCNVEVMWVSI